MFRYCSLVLAGCSLLSGMLQTMGESYYSFNKEFISTLLYSFKTLHSLACGSLCSATDDCCLYQFGEETCRLYHCDYLAILDQNAAKPTWIADSLLRNYGYSAFQTDRHYRLIKGTFDWVSCKEICSQTFPWGTMFVPRNEEEFRWIEETIILNAGKTFIGLQTDGNLQVSWVDGTPYDGVGTRTFSGLENNEMSCLKETRVLWSLRTDNKQCSCLCQLLL